MKSNVEIDDEAIYISKQNPNGWDIVIGLYHKNQYAGFIAIPYAVENVYLFGLKNGVYYFKPLI